MQILGIDVGGSGIKGAPVDTETGELLAERLRIKTPEGAQPEPVAEVVSPDRPILRLGRSASASVFPRRSKAA